jgi:hypothetical protein
VEEIAAVAGGDGKVTLAMDCITTEDSLAIIAKFISTLGILAIMLPVKMGSTLPVKRAEQLLWDIPEDKNPLPKGTKSYSSEDPPVPGAGTSHLRMLACP